MNLPPLPQGYESPPWDYKGLIWIESQMQSYGELCVKEYIKQQTRGLSHATPKFSDHQVMHIRLMHTRGEGHKYVNKLYPMSRETFFRIVGHKGAYK